MNDVATPAVIFLSRQQARRLRHYFSHGAQAYKRDFDGIDLDLLGFKLIEAGEDHFYGKKIALTALGIAVLHQHRQADIANRGVHHSLGERVAAHLRRQGRITWENVEFRNWVQDRVWKRPSQEPMVVENSPHWQCVRPDVFSIAPSLQLKYANPCVHEVKVSRSDFLGDLARPEKREAYAAMAEAVYYVAPEGMIQPAELPPGFGLLVERKEGEFVLAKRPKRRKVELQPHHYLNMIVKPGSYPDDYQI